MLEFFTMQVSILTVVLVAALAIPLYVVIELIIKPYRLVKFYENKGFVIEFKAVTGTFELEEKGGKERNEHYARMMDMCKLKNRPLGLVRNIGNSCLIMFYDSEMIKQMFAKTHIFMRHPFQNALAKELAPYGLSLLEGEEWRKHRKVFGKGFDYERMDSLIPVISNWVDAKLESFGNQITIQSLLFFYKQLAGQMIGEIFFNTSLKDKIIQGVPLLVYMSETKALLAKISYSPFYSSTNVAWIKLGLLPEHRKVFRQVKLYREAVKQIARECMAKNKANPDSKQFNMWKVFQQSGFTEDDMIDEFITFLSGGVFTTALFMTMFTYYMIKNPEWKHKLAKQLKQNILDRASIVNQKEIQSLPILQACIKESLRLAPSIATGLERIAVTDYTFENGVTVKKDTMVMACHIVNHLDERFHYNPNDYDPARWLSDTKSTQMCKQYMGCYIPFSIGERHCPGRKFAETESAIFFANLFNKFDLKLQDPNYVLQFTQRFNREPRLPIGAIIKKIQ